MSIWTNALNLLRGKRPTIEVEKDAEQQNKPTTQEQPPQKEQEQQSKEQETKKEETKEEPKKEDKQITLGTQRTKGLTPQEQQQLDILLKVATNPQRIQALKTLEQQVHEIQMKQDITTVLKELDINAKGEYQETLAMQNMEPDVYNIYKQILGSTTKGEAELLAKLLVTPELRRGIRHQIEANIKLLDENNDEIATLQIIGILPEEYIQLKNELEKDEWVITPSQDGKPPQTQIREKISASFAARQLANPNAVNLQINKLITKDVTVKRLVPTWLKH